jgi:flagellum-specific peptidoglycan hydrolase FlgJ
VLKTQEFYNGEWVTINGRFAVYEDVGASMRAHSLLLVNGTSWNPNQYARVLAATNYQQAAQALVQDGYATDPDYAKKIIRVVETYQLQRFDE